MTEIIGSRWKIQTKESGETFDVMRIFEFLFDFLFPSDGFLQLLFFHFFFVEKFFWVVVWLEIWFGFISLLSGEGFLWRFFATAASVGAFVCAMISNGFDFVGVRLMGVFSGDVIETGRVIKRDSIDEIFELVFDDHFVSMKLVLEVIDGEIERVNLFLEEVLVDASDGLFLIGKGYLFDLS